MRYYKLIYLFIFYCTHCGAEIIMGGHNDNIVISNDFLGSHATFFGYLTNGADIKDVHVSVFSKGGKAIFLENDTHRNKSLFWYNLNIPANIHPDNYLVDVRIYDMNGNKFTYKNNFTVAARGAQKIIYNISKKSPIFHAFMIIFITILTANIIHYISRRIKFI